MAKKDRKYFTTSEEVDPHTGRIKTNVTYTGTHYVTPLTQAAFKRVGTSLVLFSLMSAVCYLFAGFQNGKTGHNFFTMVPYGIMILPQAFLLIAAFRLAFKKVARFTEPERRQIAERIQICGFMLTLLGIWCAIAGLIIAGMNDMPKADVAFSVLMFGCAAWGFSAMRENRKLGLETEGTAE